MDAAAPSLITLPSLEGRAGVDVKEGCGCRSLHVLIRAHPQKKKNPEKKPLWSVMRSLCGEKKKIVTLVPSCEPAHSRSHYGSDSAPLFCASLICRNEPRFPPRYQTPPLQVDLRSSANLDKYQPFVNLVATTGPFHRWWGARTLREVTGTRS